MIFLILKPELFMKRGFLLFVFIFTSLAYCNASTCVALSSGNWETAGTWSCGHVPTCGDSAYIPVAITVTVTAVNTYGCAGTVKLVIAGTLDFVTGKKLEFPCGSSLYLLAGGTINPGGGGGSSNLISICGTDYWIAGQGTITGPMCFNCALPIQLVGFNAVCNGTAVNVTWATATETNNHYFSIERCDDGYSWAEVARINGAGTSSAAHYYSWSDAEPLPGTSYYRLKQTDMDGQYTYPGSVVATSCNNDGVVTIYPNPTRGNVYCKLNSSAAQTVSVKIIGVFGQTISEYTEDVVQGVSTQQIHTQDLAAGTYLFIITFPNNSVVIRKPFVVSK
jgi:hypothetical protein